jgi:hypothetical protein
MVSGSWILWHTMTYANTRITRHRAPPTSCSPWLPVLESTPPADRISFRFHPCANKHDHRKSCLPAWVLSKLCRYPSVIQCIMWDDVWRMMMYYCTCCLPEGPCSTPPQIPARRSSPNLMRRLAHAHVGNASMMSHHRASQKKKLWNFEMLSSSLLKVSAFWGIFIDIMMTSCLTPAWCGQTHDPNCPDEDPGRHAIVKAPGELCISAWDIQKKCANRNSKCHKIWI